MNSADAVDRWLADFARCVRERDLVGGRELFAPDAAGFGTVAGRYADRDDLVAQQWSDVWPRTEGFTFSDVDARWSDGTICAVAATWRSVAAGDGRVRTGRATLVLRRDGDRLLAVHSHFSMTPGSAA